jgi:hypothetical protein
MTKEKGEGVAIVAHGIALKSVTLIFIGDPELQPAPALKAESLLVDAEPFTRNPHVSRIVV